MDYTEWKRRQKADLKRRGVLLPLVSRQTYSARDRRLRESGLLQFERFWLCYHRLNTPAMKYMRRMRYDMWGVSIERGDTRAQYERQIRKWYKAQGWVFRDGTLNPFLMLEFYRDRINEDATPSPKKKVIKKDFVAYKERAITKEHKGNNLKHRSPHRETRYPFREGSKR